MHKGILCVHLNLLDLESKIYFGLESKALALV
ncbi:hypothetical protein BGP_6546 [Beggiatoa sp. PS]|nr:hypothetical protein BGP_6546 [Beggiatoa sp. PS]